ncbi:MAG: cell division protein FtsZ [Gammaproteobacteria bacterium]|nr:cell division protein FtsZ [Gammaproteobacteria bacterium]CAJ2376896.1 MAG: cell division protein FtsZ [Arenicellales bacterium IbO2]MDA7961652.1 cell division protein FtsZ [Gammaproteobacteria bacterium]MDA7969833.1 cell division protein FtsZ [Gammaproteobacteria bacterium]MDA7971886.1 cell division protein FtsZ [Gammaproteobacteria bacterium]
MFEIVDTVSQQATIKVVGIGGGGGNAVEHMVKADLAGVGFINANTDAQALNASKAPTVLQIGEGLTKGLGAGANPEVGRQAALEDRERIASSIEGADMVFIAAGMGGGTGTGAAPVIAEVAREMGMLSVAVVTKPFPFEGEKRMEQALRGIENLQGRVDSLIIIPNEKVLAVMGQNAPMREAFHKADEVLFNAVQGISELITRPGLINVDFADVRTVMSEMGMAMMGSATASGENRAVEAAGRAISSPLLEDIDLRGAKGILVNIAAGKDMAIGEYEAVGTAIGEYAAQDAKVVIGVVVDESMKDELRVTMVATGLVDSRPPETGTPETAAEAPPDLPRKQAPKLPATAANEPDDAPEANAAAEADAGEVVQPVSPAKSAGAAVQPVPPARRNGKAQRGQTPPPLDMDLLDLPAFLRRQAD